MTFGSKDLHVLDLAGGTGAGILGIVSSIVELLPELPLNIYLYAADISTVALSIYSEVADELSQQFRAAAINVEFKATEWDATKPASTNLLCNAWLNSVGSSETFVLISNLSGAGNALLEDFKRSFQHVTERVSHLPNTVMWVEPESAEKFLKKVVKLIFEPASWFTQPSSHDFSATYKWFHKLQFEKKKSKEVFGF